MITLYHLDQSRSERIIWLMEELGLEYRLEVFLRQPDLYAPDALRAALPLGGPRPSATATCCWRSLAPSCST